MTPVDRLVEIVGIMLQRDLTFTEARELRESHRWIVNHEWQQARILNLMKLARDTHDWDWAKQLQEEYDKLMG